VPKVKYPVNGAALEVKIKRQVVLYVIDGRLKRIIDSSTGGGYYYTNSSGGTSKAVTPTGHFSIQYKINGWHKSKLGTMYRPAYFNNQGYAIHGEGAVPPHPASHGCVRITVPAMDRMYDKIFLGMSVWIY
jgi:lipoprotein-anchoring transpeptidase ErfK/SrfK